jgi:hypothetical protein
MTADSSKAAYQRSRQKVTLLVLATLLFVGGLLVLFALKRLPLPMRIMTGLGDFVAGSALLLILRGNFRK